RADAATAERLAFLGFARRHGPHDAYCLTPEGQSLRRALLSASDPPPAAPGTPSVGFTPATGDGPPHSGDRRAGAAAQAWRSLLEIRRLTGTTSVTGSPGHSGIPSASVPADWERARPLHAVALALEAGGRTASAVDAAGSLVRNGYLVTGESADPGTVRVYWRTGANDDPDRKQGRESLQDYAYLLSACGWGTERYTDSRRRPYLLVTPRRGR
ncbi:hypothetical protein N566_24570, partial [Streptomycetaceae bacterium MP113-05]